MDKEWHHLLQGHQKAAKQPVRNRLLNTSKRFSPYLWVVTAIASEPIMKRGSDIL